MAISISTWWFQHVAFSPSADTSVAHAILGDAEIRSDVATLIASADAAPLNVSTTQLKEFVEQISRLNDGAALMRGFVSDAHARLIGENDAPVIITPTEQYTIVRDERAALSPDLTLPVPIVGSLSFINTATRWIMIASAAGALLLFIAGFLTRPERGELTFALAVGLAVTGVGVILLGYLVPVGPLTGLSESTWMGVFPRLANKSLGSTLLLGITSIVSGVIIMLGTRACASDDSAARRSASVATANNKPGPAKSDHLARSRLRCDPENERSPRLRFGSQRLHFVVLPLGFEPRTN